MNAQRPAFYLGNTLLVLALVTVAAWAAWPIYQSVQFVILVAASAVLALGISFLGARFRLSWITVAIASVVVYLIVGVPLAVPSSLNSLLSGWLSLVTGSVFGWKQLVTIAIPVGSYQALLVPALMVFLFGTVAALSIAIRTMRFSAFAVVVTAVMQLFGLIFGSSAVSPTIALGPVSIGAPRELVIGIVGFLVGLAFLLWRVNYTRRIAIRIAQSTAGIRQSRESTGSLVRRMALAAAVLAVAVVVTGIISPALGAAQQKSVLRESIDPLTAEQLAVSPLSSYRNAFKSTGADNNFNTALFGVSITTATPFRIRVATLSHYDGQFFTAVDPKTPSGTEASAFVRVPYRLDPGAAGATATVTLTIDAYRGLWMPTVGDLSEARFSGANSATLSDHFFYNRLIGAGIETSPLTAGDGITIDTVIPVEPVSIADVTKPQVPISVDNTLMPTRLVDWVDAQGANAGNLAALVTTLRASGFLSHSIDNPADSGQAWPGELGAQYRWAGSAAGHSIDRIDTLFDQLLAQKAKVDSGVSSSLVSGIGDDEQFATAVALVAQHLGYRSRVVLGFAVGTDSADSPDNSIPACTDVCTGKNLTAWAEVQDGATGSWITVPATPQHLNLPNTDTPQRRDPQNPSAVQPQTATQEDPPASSPNGSDETTPTQAPTTTDLTLLRTILTTVGLSLLGVVVVLAPFATILIAKTRRRRERRMAVNAEQRIVGGWDEYVDAAIDHGYPITTTDTRKQVAALYDTPRGTVLAAIADRAVFGPLDPEHPDGDRFWELLESERLEFARGMNRWQRWRAAVSLRSFTQYLRRRPSR